MPIPQRKSPLILFNHPDFPVNFHIQNYSDNKCFTVATQTFLQTNTLCNSYCQTDTSKHDISIQVDINDSNKKDVNTGECQKQNSTYFGNFLNILPIFPTNLFQSTINRSNTLPITDIYQPITRYSPMATLLTPLGNKTFILFFSGSKFTQESIQD